MSSSEWDALREQLSAAGVQGVEDLGRFVSNTEHFEPSRFDERGAFSHLLSALPTLTDATLVEAVAGHLRRPWARGEAFGPLVAAFTQWAAEEPITGWHLGDALGSAASLNDVGVLVAIVRRTDLGMARQMVVLALGRFRGSDEATYAAREHADDDDVALHALQAYRKLAGPKAALVRAREVVELRPGSPAANQASREARKLEKALARRPPSRRSCRFAAVAKELAATLAQAHRIARSANDPDWVSEVFVRMAMVEQMLVQGHDADALAQLGTWAARSASTLRLGTEAS